MQPDSAVILLVEDDANDVVLITRAFTKAGAFGVIEAVGDGDAALAYLRGEGRYADRQRYPFPDVVLLDLKLPRRSGLEVLEWIRGQHPLRRLPTVMLTSSRDATDVDRAYDLGANSYLVKPVGFDELQRLVAEVSRYWLEHNQGPDAQSA
ncbi:MAG TPA: response regulator [Gemmatimonadales bacterium]|nr:response regulator [Gemmatimonadales bacterium]